MTGRPLRDPRTTGARALQTTDALHERATLNEADYAAIAAHYSEAQFLEIMMLCGFYRTVAYIASGLKLPLEGTAARFPKA